MDTYLDRIHHQLYNMVNIFYLFQIHTFKIILKKVINNGNNNSLLIFLLVSHVVIPVDFHNIIIKIILYFHRPVHVILMLQCIYIMTLVDVVLQDISDRIVNIYKSKHYRPHQVYLWHP